ncbi:MAG: hypothetical protein HY275_11970 [Gemmatimonadetes bacterium]|nr:hypothetical protein [Gemmatimonadota bacterium]
MSEPTVTPRRGFLGRLSASLLAAGVLPTALRAAPADHDAPLAVDEAWLDALNGKYRQVFDIKSAGEGGSPLAPVRNFLNAYRDAYGVNEREVNAVVGFHGGAAQFAFSDDAWQKFRFGQSLNLIDPATHMPYLKNPALGAGAGDTGIPALQARGVTFLVCNNSLMRVVRGVVAGGYGTEESVRAELTGALLLKGVIIVPAMQVALNRLQMRGVSYVSAS